MCKFLREKPVLCQLPRVLFKAKIWHEECFLAAFM